MKKKVAIVTGGGRGIGRAICRRLAQTGAHVVAMSRKQSDLDECVKLITGEGGQCSAVSVDVSDGDALEAAIAQVIADHGRIDVLVNNAGVASLATLEETDPARFEATMSVNVNAVYRACRAVWSVMRKQGEGVIVSISSLASVDPFPGFAAYGASKAWVNLWTKALGEEGRAHGIRVFAVAPGAVETDMLRGAFPDFPSAQTLDPMEVGDMVATLTEPACRHATGQTIFLKK